MAKRQDKKAEEITVAADQEPVGTPTSAKEAYAQQEKRLQVQKYIKGFSSFAEIQQFLNDPQQFIADAKERSDKRFSDMSVEMMNDVKNQIAQDLKDNEVTADEKALAQEATKDPIGRAMFKAATAVPQTSEKVEAKTFLQRVKAAVEKGIENIDAKVSEVKAAMDAKKQDRQQAREERNSAKIEKDTQRKIEKEVKKFEQGGNVLERMAQKAKDKIAALGDKAMDKIMKSSAKRKSVEREISISQPFDAHKSDGRPNNAEQGNAGGPYSKQMASLQATWDMLDNARAIDAPDNAATFQPLREVIPGLTQGDLDDLLKDVNAPEQSMSSAEIDEVLAAPKLSDAAMDLEWASIEAAVDEALGDMEIVQQDFATNASTFVAQMPDQTQSAKQAPEAAKPESSAPVKEAWEQAIDDQLNSIDFNKKVDTSKTNDSGSAPSTPTMGRSG